MKENIQYSVNEEIKLITSFSLRPPLDYQAKKVNLGLIKSPEKN